MKIKYTLMFTYGLLIILSFIIVMGNLVTFSTMESDSNFVNYLGKLRVTNYKMAQLSNVLVNNQDQKTSQELEDSIEDLESLMIILLKGDKELGMSTLEYEETIEKLDQINLLWDTRYKIAYNSILTDGDFNSLKIINEEIDTYVNYIDEMVTSYSENANSKVTRARFMNRIMIIITIIISLSSFYIINKEIKQPIDLLMRNLKETSYRDSKFTDEFESVSNDEISLMGSYFNELVYDSLTKAFNRGSGLGKLGRIYEDNAKRDLIMSLCFIDINGLKDVNDLLGHDYGDDLIISTVKGIKNLIRDDDFIIRLGGDEFLIVFRGINIDMAETVWDRILNIYDKINKEEDRSYKISVSHGIVEYNYNLRYDLDNLIKEADEKMYEEKRKMKTDLVVVKQDK